GALRDATERAVGAAPGASLPAGASHVLLRGRALPTRPADLAPSLVRADDGAWVRLSDVVRVEEGMIPRIGAGTANGRGEVVYVMCQMLTGANALEVMGRIHAALPTVRRSLPSDVDLEITYDRSDLVEATLHTVGSSLLEGGILVALVLFAMLGSVRAGSLVASVIPLSMLGAVVWMVAFDVPGNLMSLGALDFGLLVDGAVVVVETTFHALEHRRAHGKHLGPAEVRETIAQSTAQVATPVFYAVAIIGLVYVPVVTLGGVEGVMFRPMALTVLFALSTALVLSLTFIPAAAATFIRWKDVPEKDPLLPRLASAAYARVLPITQKQPAILLALVVLGMASGVLLFSLSGTEFIPTLDEGDIVSTTQRHSDISLEAEIERNSAVERAVLGVPEVVGAYHRVGSAAVATDTMGIEQADLFLRMRPRSEWAPGRTHDVVVEALDQAIREVDPQVVLGFTHPIQMRFNELLGGSTSDVSLSIVGDDLAELQRLAQASAALLSTVEGAVDIRITSPPAVPLLDVVPRPLDASALGLDATDVLDVITAQRTGLEVAVTRDGPLRIPVRVRLSGTPSAFDLRDAPIPVGRTVVPLSRVADVTNLAAPGLVDHDQGDRRIVIAFNVRGRDLGSVVAEAQARFDREIPLPDGYLPKWGGQYENLEAAQARLLLVLPVVLFGVLVLLRKALGRWRSALLVFGNVPFAALGGITLLWLRDMPISISAAIGFIALSGIAVMNGVVLVSRIHHEEESGLSSEEAAVRAAQNRLRPVLMTALVAGLGFVPMMIATGVGAEVQAPLATVVVGGLVTSTVLTLIVLPAVYARVAGVRRASDTMMPTEVT
ncbi:MAG: CusA/CzcA family heavy metal efflux RND transporter, partial [Sandaracinaceae bacterium]|nr:CusA/CzcA family heavy metal efflux RND transporter [Sandaracinaceae bacterium]